MASSARKSEAYHEAGHAVTACLLEVAFAKASIQLEEGSGSGRVAQSVLKRHKQRAAQAKISALERRVQVAVAGAAAEGLLRGQVDPDWERFSDLDLDLVLTCLDPLTSGVDYEEPFRDFWNQARVRLQEPETWKAVGRVAEALLEEPELSQEEVLCYLRE